jgi:hypothetical protein
MNSTAPIHVPVAARNSISANARLRHRLNKDRIMKKYEYEITEHPAGEFQQLAYFCSAEGECSAEQIPKGQVTKLKDILNERGLKGWELIQLSFNSGGVIAFWKRNMDEV